MPRAFQRFLAFVLLALWMPVTSHCSISSVFDWIGQACEQTSAHESDTHSPHSDACELLEGGDFQPSALSPLTPAPSLSVLSCLARLHARLLDEARPLAPPASSRDDPADWVPRWVFSARAALPARAPSLT